MSRIMLMVVAAFFCGVASQFGPVGFVVSFVGMAVMGWNCDEWTKERK